MKFTEEQIKEAMSEYGMGRVDAIRILERTEADWQSDYEEMLDAYTL